MRQRFYCQNCEQVLEFDQTVPDISNKEKRNCKVCGHTALPNNFTENNKQYATCDHYKAAALFCMGAEEKEIDTTDPQNVVFLFTTHDKMIDGEPAILRFVRDYHSANLVTYNINPAQLITKDKEYMRLVREARLNKEYAKRQGGK